MSLDALLTPEQRYRIEKYRDERLEMQNPRKIKNYLPKDNINEFTITRYKR